MMMKIAIINQASSTGGWKYLYFLAQGIKTINHTHEITVFYRSLESLPSEILAQLTTLNVQLVKLKQRDFKYIPKRKFKNNMANKVYNTIRETKLTLKRIGYPSITQQLNQFDVVHYAWPYNIEPFKTTTPSFFIPHDFIYSHFMGAQGYTLKEAYRIKQEHEQFLSVAKPIVSTPFIAKELQQLFPQYSEQISVVYLSHFNEAKPLNPEIVKERLTHYQITDDYILYANNISPHKNLGQVIGAYYYVKQHYPNLKLIITGYATDGLQGTINCPYYVDWLTDTEHSYDVKSFGLLEDEAFYTLMQGAKMVINPSLCEAGSGSGLDAWTLGVPMVMSNIPAFQDQLNFLGVKAELFEPRESKDIARAILHLLDNPNIAAENVRLSKEAMQRYTWEDVAKQYLSIFEQTVQSQANSKQVTHGIR
jgi:glycosyltransferase involved in cell wall biosynthesis